MLPSTRRALLCPTCGQIRKDNEIFRDQHFSTTLPTEETTSTQALMAEVKTEVIDSMIDVKEEPTEFPSVENDDYQECMFTTTMLEKSLLDEDPQIFAKLYEEKMERPGLSSYDFGYRVVDFPEFHNQNSYFGETSEPRPKLRSVDEEMMGDNFHCSTFPLEVQEKLQKPSDVTLYPVTSEKMDSQGARKNADRRTRRKPFRYVHSNPELTLAQRRVLENNYQSNKHPSFGTMMRLIADFQVKCNFRTMFKYYEMRRKAEREECVEGDDCATIRKCLETEWSRLTGELSLRTVMQKALEHQELLRKEREEKFPMQPDELTSEKQIVLMKRFEENMYPNEATCQFLAVTLKLTLAQVQQFFLTRRMLVFNKIENIDLEKEVAAIPKDKCEILERSIKLSPRMYTTRRSLLAKQLNLPVKVVTLWCDRYREGRDAAAMREHYIKKLLGK